jgi:hypothetical protein
LKDEGLICFRDLIDSNGLIESKECDGVNWANKGREYYYLQHGDSLTGTVIVKNIAEPGTYVWVSYKRIK